MNLPSIAIEGKSIVMLGSFNPAIFQPAWFAAQGLIREAEAADAKVEVIHSEVTQFSLEWLNVQVLHDRFTASSVQPPSFDLLRDFVVGTFTVLLHTPVTMLGLNSDRHFDMKSEDEWHRLGRRLAPPDPWKSALEGPGLRSLLMQGARTDEMEGMILVKVEPSTQIEFGVYVNVNDHYDLRSAEKSVVTTESAVGIIRDQWAASSARPDVIASAIFGATK